MIIILDAVALTEEMPPLPDWVWNIIKGSCYPICGLPEKSLPRGIVKKGNPVVMDFSIKLTYRNTLPLGEIT